MAAQPGHKKVGGRAKGTPNKLSLDIREYIKMIIDNNIKKAQADLDSLEPKDRLIILEKLLQYVIPRKKEEEITISERDKLMKKLFGNNEETT